MRGAPMHQQTEAVAPVDHRPANFPQPLAVSVRTAAVAAARRREIIAGHYLNTGFDYCQQYVLGGAPGPRSRLFNTDRTPYLSSSSSEYNGSRRGSAAEGREIFSFSLHTLILFVPAALGPGRIIRDKVASSNRLVLLNAPLISALVSNTSRNTLLPRVSLRLGVFHPSPLPLNKQSSLSAG